LAFHHIVGTFDGAKSKIIQGRIAARWTLERRRLLLRLPLALVIGAKFLFGLLRSTANIDEVHISNTNRSAAWITAEYNNQKLPRHIHHNGKRVVPIVNTPHPLLRELRAQPPTATPTPHTPPTDTDTEPDTDTKRRTFPPPPYHTYTPLRQPTHQLLRRQLRLRQQQAHLGMALPEANDDRSH